jgi:hypothetical protein
LFREPPGFAPEFHWRRSGIFWSRRPNRDTDELLNWIGARAPQSSSATSADGNVYLFSRADAADPLRFSVMSQSGIVLIGAGTALLLGWMLVEWPKTRHVLTLPVLGFFASLLAVWFSGPVLVLSQAAALGLLVAIVAAGVDAYRTRRMRLVAVTLTAPGGFAKPGSAITRGVVAAAGTKEFASARAPAAAQTESIEAPQPAGHSSEFGGRA